MPAARGVAWARFRIAALFVAAVAILAVLVYLLTGGTLLQEQVILYLYVPDATGLEGASPVRVNGTDVGKVRAVALSGSSAPSRVVRLTLTVRREHLADIPADSTAQISSEGVVGNKYVDITQGKNAARIRPEGEIGYKADVELLKALDLEDFVKQLRTADEILTDIEQGRTPIGKFVHGTEMYRDFQQGLADLDRGFREATNPNNTLGQVLSTDQDYRKIRALTLQLDDGLARIQAGQGPNGRLLREDGQYREFLDQATGLRKSIAEYRDQELLKSDAQYAAWNREVRSWIARVDEINTSPMFSNSAPYDNLTGLLRETRATMQEFRQNPRKFLRIQLF